MRLFLFKEFHTTCLATNNDILFACSLKKIWSYLGISSTVFWRWCNTNFITSIIKFLGNFCLGCTCFDTDVKYRKSDELIYKMLVRIGYHNTQIDKEFRSRLLLEWQIERGYRIWNNVSSSRFNHDGITCVPQQDEHSLRECKPEL